MKKHEKNHVTADVFFLQKYAYLVHKATDNFDDFSVITFTCTRRDTNLIRYTHRN